MDRAFPLDNRSLRVLLAFAHVLFDHARPFDNEPLFFGDDRYHPSALAFIGPGDDDYFIIFSDMK